MRPTADIGLSPRLRRWASVRPAATAEQVAFYDGRKARYYMSMHRWAGYCPADREWDEIKKSLRNVGVDGDAVRIKTPICSDPVVALRDGLAHTAIYCDFPSHPHELRKRPTPSQLAEKQGRTIDRCKELIAWLDRVDNTNRFDLDSHSRRRRWPLQFPRLADLTLRTRAQLETFVDELERCHAELKAMGTSRGKKNRTPHNQFWKELTRVFLAIIGKNFKWRNNHLESFLLACSKPFFPGKKMDEAIKAFVERHAASSK